MSHEPKLLSPAPPSPAPASLPRLVYSGGGGPPGPARRAPERSNAVLGMLVFLGSEAMLFAALISAYLVLRAGAESWPPPGQPRLPIALTGINTFILLLSGLTMWRARGAARVADMGAGRRWLAVTLALGMTFLAIQGREWMELVRFGLRLSSSIYGGIFYALIGMHAVHVLVAVLVLAWVLWRARQASYSPARQTEIEVAGLYWLFVVGVWPLLYVLVYLL